MPLAGALASLGALRSPRGGRAIAALICVAAVAWTVHRATTSREWNFDTIGYADAALAWSVADPVVRHRDAYAALADAVPADAHRSVATGSRYRKVLFRDAVAFATQRRFYANKPAYVAAVAALHATGVNVVRATRLVSVAAFALVWAVLLAWLWRRDAGAWCIGFLAALACAPPFTVVASLATPDMLACLPLVVGACAIHAGRPVAGLAIIASAVLIRPDCALAVACLCAWSTFAAPADRRVPLQWTLSIAVAAVAVAAVVPPVLGAANLRVVLRHTFEESLFAPGRMDETISFAGYLSALARGLDLSRLHDPSVLGLHAALTCMVLALRLPAVSQDARRPLIGWLLAAWAYVPLHYLLWPDPSDRFFAPTYLLAALGALWWISEASPTACARRRAPG